MSDDTRQRCSVMQQQLQQESGVDAAVAILQQELASPESAIVTGTACCQPQQQQDRQSQQLLPQQIQQHARDEQPRQHLQPIQQQQQQHITSRGGLSSVIPSSGGEAVPTPAGPHEEHLAVLQSTGHAGPPVVDGSLTGSPRGQHMDWTEVRENIVLTRVPALCLVLQT